MRMSTVRTPGWRHRRWLRAIGVVFGGTLVAAARRVAADVGPAAGLDVSVGRPVGADSGSQAGGTGDGAVRPARPGGSARAARRPQTPTPGARAADLPHRHQLRSRRRHRHRQQGQAGRRSEAGGLRGVRGQQAADDRDLQAGAASTGSRRPGRERRAQIRTDYDEETEAQRDDVRHLRDLARRLSRAPRREHGGARAARPLHPQPARADGSDRHHVSAHAGRRRCAFTRNHEGGHRARSSSSTAASSTIGRATSSRSKYSMYPVEIVERIRNQVSLSRARAVWSPRLGGLREGRKSVILVSEGYSNYVPPQLRDPVAEMPGHGQPEPPQPAGRRRQQHERGSRAVLRRTSTSRR